MVFKSEWDPTSIPGKHFPTDYDFLVLVPRKFIVWVL